MPLGLRDDSGVLRQVEATEPQKKDASCGAIPHACLGRIGIWGRTAAKLQRAEDVMDFRG